MVLNPWYHLGSFPTSPTMLNSFQRRYFPIAVWCFGVWLSAALSCWIAFPPLSSDLGPQMADNAAHLQRTSGGVLSNASAGRSVSVKLFSPSVVRFNDFHNKA